MQGKIKAGQVLQRGSSTAHLHFYCSLSLYILSLLFYCPFFPIYNLVPGSQQSLNSPEIHHKIHSAIVVLRANDPHVLSQHYEHDYEFLRRYFRNAGIRKA
jgi:hypothetical protein